MHRMLYSENEVLTRELEGVHCCYSVRYLAFSPSMLEFCSVSDTHSNSHTTGRCWGYFRALLTFGNDETLEARGSCELLHGLRGRLWLGKHDC